MQLSELKHQYRPEASQIGNYLSKPERDVDIRIEHQNRIHHDYGENVDYMGKARQQMTDKHRGGNPIHRSSGRKTYQYEAQDYSQ